MELKRLFLAEVEVEEEEEEEEEGADRAEGVSDGATLSVILFCEVWSTALCVGSYLKFVGGGQGGFWGGIMDGVDAVCNGVLNSLSC
jgi:tetrahydromethanopterin S-methyltransferase subunit A